MAQAPGATDRDVAAPPDSATLNRLLLEALKSHPRRFTFFQSIRLLERFSAGEKLGEAALPRKEALRLGGYASLGFPAWDIDEIFEEPNPWGNPPNRFRLTATFLGLYGPASPLPAWYTDYIIRPQDAEDPEDRERIREFMDVFNHRLLSLFYRCLLKYRYHLLFDPAGGRDRFSRQMLSLIGRGTKGLDRDRPVAAVQMLRYAGLLTTQPKCAAGLEGILRDYLGVPLTVRQCMGRWLRVEDRNVMGQSFCKLGEDLIVGAQVYDRTGKLRISTGPVGIKSFMQFLPRAQLTREVRELVRLYLVDELEFDLEVSLKGDEVPPTHLGAGELGGMLGWTTWLSSGPGPDVSVVFRV